MRSHAQGPSSRRAVPQTRLCQRGLSYEAEPEADTPHDYGPLAGPAPDTQQLPLPGCAGPSTPLLLELSHPSGPAHLPA